MAALAHPATPADRVALVGALGAFTDPAVLLDQPGAHWVPGYGHAPLDIFPFGTMLVAPCTFNTLNKLSHGIADHQHRFGSQAVRREDFCNDGFFQCRCTTYLSEIRGQPAALDNDLEFGFRCAGGNKKRNLAEIGRAHV